MNFRLSHTRLLPWDLVNVLSGRFHFVFSLIIIIWLHKMTSSMEQQESTTAYALFYLESFQGNSEAQLGSRSVSFTGSDSLPGILSPKLHNNSTEDLQALPLRRRQGRQRHPSLEVGPPPWRPGLIAVFPHGVGVRVCVFQSDQTETEPCGSSQKRYGRSGQKGNSVLFSVTFEGWRKRNGFSICHGLMLM